MSGWGGVMADRVLVGCVCGGRPYVTGSVRSHFSVSLKRRKEPVGEHQL